MCVTLMDTEITKYIEKVYGCLSSEIKINYLRNNIDIKIKNKEVDIKKICNYIKNKFDIKESEKIQLFLYVQEEKCEYKNNCKYFTYRYEI